MPETNNEYTSNNDYQNPVQKYICVFLSFELVLKHGTYFEKNSRKLYIKKLESCLLVYVCSVQGRGGGDGIMRSIQLRRNDAVAHCSDGSTEI